jgi:hypothetical protein
MHADLEARVLCPDILIHNLQFHKLTSYSKLNYNHAFSSGIDPIRLNSCSKVGGGSQNNARALFQN